MSARIALAGLAALLAAATAPGSAAEAPEWSVRVGVPGAAAVDLHLASRGGYHVNLDYPIGFVPAPGATVTFAGARVRLAPASATPCEGRPKETCAVTLSLPYAAPPAGEARIAGTLAFSVCTAERCLIEKVPLSVVLRRG